MSDQTCTSCGSPEHHAHDCLTETSKRRVSIEVVSDYSRTCSKCKKTVQAAAKGFRFSDLTKNFEVCEWEMPRGWAHFAHDIWHGKYDSPTTFMTAICPDCIPSVLEFIGWKDSPR
jgi:hypothetical protein